MSWKENQNKKLRQPKALETIRLFIEQQHKVELKIVDLRKRCPIGM